MNISKHTLLGLKVEVVPTGTVIETEECAVTVTDKTTASDNSTIWMTENTHQNLLLNRLHCTGPEILDFIQRKSLDPQVPAQSVIDSWPQHFRKPELNTDEQKHFSNAQDAMEYVP